MNLRIDSNISLECDNTDVLSKVISHNTFHNPKYHSNERNGRSNRGVDPYITTYSLIGNTIVLPRGYFNHLLEVIQKTNVKIELVDNTTLFAGFERLLIKSRTKSALRAKKDRGERVGHIPFGYRLSQDAIHLEEDELEQSILNQIKELRESGCSIRKIAFEMNKRGAFNRGQAEWNHASVHRMLKMAA